MGFLVARCPHDKILGLEPAFIEIRKLEKIKEPKPAIFYIKSSGFMHFHTKDGRIWADVFNAESWIEVDIPEKITKTFLKKFIQIVTKNYEICLNK